MWLTQWWILDKKYIYSAYICNIFWLLGFLHEFLVEQQLKYIYMILHSLSYFFHYINILGEQKIFQIPQSKHSEDHKEHLPSTFSSALIWSLPCVTMSAVLEAVEIISSCVFCVMEWVKQRCTCLAVYCPSGVRLISIPHRLLLFIGRTHKRSHGVWLWHSPSGCHQVTWATGPNQPPRRSRTGQLKVQLSFVLLMLLHSSPGGWHLSTTGYE